MVEAAAAKPRQITDDQDWWSINWSRQAAMRPPFIGPCEAGVFSKKSIHSRDNILGASVDTRQVRLPGMSLAGSTDRGYKLSSFAGVCGPFIHDGTAL